MEVAKTPNLPSLSTPQIRCRVIGKICVSTRLESKRDHSDALGTKKNVIIDFINLKVLKQF